MYIYIYICIYICHRLIYIYMHTHTHPYRFIVSASADGTIRVWNILTGIDECFTRCEHPVSCLAKTPDNDVFAAGDDEGGLHIFKLWNLTQGD